MKYSQARQGRVFVIRLEDGEVLHEAIEQFSIDQNIAAAGLIILGGVGKGSKFIVGPEDGDARPVVPMQYEIEDVHEIVGTGTIFPDESGKPVLHMHVASGRLSQTVTGCVRSGVKVWQVAEIILFELRDSTAVRRVEPESGFTLLNPE